MTYKYSEITLETEKLFTKQQILTLLNEYGENWHGLCKIRELEYEQHGCELTRHYPISDGEFLGFFIIPIQEGILKIPYDEVDKQDGELLITTSAKLMDFNDAAFAAEDWTLFSNDLAAVLEDIKTLTEQMEGTI